MEQIIAFIALIWIGFGDRMLNPKKSRPKRVLFFFLFYIPLAVVLVWAGTAVYSITYNTLGLLGSLVLYAIAAFLLPFLFSKAWFASREKEKTAYVKMRMRIMRFWVKYKNRFMNKKNKLIVRILLFALMFLPFYAIPGLIMLIARGMIPLILPFIYVIAFLTVVSAALVFSGKNK
jgi:hypothetical protein